MLGRGRDIYEIGVALQVRGRQHNFRQLDRDIEKQLRRVREDELFLLSSPNSN